VVAQKNPTGDVGTQEAGGSRRHLQHMLTFLKVTLPLSVVMSIVLPR
jgi:hypothetical protein